MISVDSHLTFSFCHPFCPPGRLMFLSSWIHVKDTCTKVSSPSKLHSHKLVPLLASACSAVRQLYFHRENTWTGGASCLNSVIQSKAAFKITNSDADYASVSNSRYLISINRN